MNQKIKRSIKCQLMVYNYCWSPLTTSLPSIQIMLEVKWSESRSVISDSLQPHGLYRILQAGILEWVAFPFTRGSSQPRDQTHLSRIAGKFFTSWATREAQEYWPIPSPVDLPDPGVEPGSPALQVDSLPTELSGKPKMLKYFQ